MEMTKIWLPLLACFCVLLNAAVSEDQLDEAMKKSILGQVWTRLTENSIFGRLADHPVDIRAVLEGVRLQMHRAQPLLGLPQMDPLMEHNIPIDIDNDMGRLVGEVREVTVRGLSQFEARRFTLRPLSARVDFHLLFPTVTAAGLYEVQGKLPASLAVHGDGPFNIIIRDLNATGFMSFTRSGDHLKVKDLFVEVTIKNLQADLQNLCGGGEQGRLLCATLSHASPRLLAAYRTQVSTELVKVLRPLVDQRLRSVGPASLLACAASGGLGCLKRS